ncbi:unnamed protein product [Rotaria magnacalcarata]|uniref:TTF-type domain-containing protein n=1 Tax=Rotaria magnacalcarata TaxID=392030 RepID=A0A816Z9R1_9BILA|nr:unnamed protein product [Rotaria magnacalcarata]
MNNRPVVDSCSIQKCLERDPGAYISSPRFSTDEMKYLIELGPRATNNLAENDDVESTSKKSLSFQDRWYCDYPLIEYSILKDRAYCFACRLFGSGPGSLLADRAWTTNGVYQWKKMTGKYGKLNKHFKSTAHISAYQQRVYVNHRQQELLKLNRYVISTLLDVTKVLTRQSLSFRAEIESEGNFNQIVSLLRRHNNILNQWYNDTSLRSHQTTYLSNNAQNEFISIVGKAIHNSIITRINKSLFWSVMVDTTPDISHKDMMSIIIRFVNEAGEAEERLFYIGEIQDKTGKGIADNILLILKTFALDINKLIGQSYDGGLNMCGEYKGVKAMLSESVGREVIFVPCCAHCSNKIVEHASQNSLEAAKFFGLCEKLYVFLTGSTKRVIYPTCVGLRNIQYSSVVAIHESFNEIVDTLDELCNDNDKTTKLEANSIREKIVSYEYYCLLLFVKHLMSMTNALTTTLQDEDLDVLSAIDSLTKTICLLNKLRDDEDTTNKLLELAKERIAKYDVDADDEFSKTHRRRVRSLQVYYRKIFYQMMDQLKSEYIDLLKALEEKLKPFSCLWPSKIPDFRKEDAEQIKIIVPGIDSSDLLYYDVQLLIDDLQNCSSIRDVMVLFSQHNYQKSYSRLYRVYVFIYTLPVTVASNERAFSRLKLIKNYLRSKMFDERLMDLILCSSEKDLADSLNLDELVTTWNTKPRRLLV